MEKSVHTCVGRSVEFRSIAKASMDGLTHRREAESAKAVQPKPAVKCGRKDNIARGFLSMPSRSSISR